ncbi:DUF624 domain-containing protein [Aerococcus viridans]
MFKSISKQMNRRQTYTKNFPAIINKIGVSIYILVCTHFLWTVSVMAGGVIFGILPANKTIYQVQKELSDSKTTNSGERFPIFQFWWSRIKINLKELWFVSWMISLVQLILTASWIWLSQTQGIITIGLFYLSIFLWLIWAIVSITFAYFMAAYPNISKSELFKNAFCYPLVFLLEYIICMTIITVSMTLVWNTIPGLVVFLGISASLLAFGVFLEIIQSGYVLKKLFSNWRRIE